MNGILDSIRERRSTRVPFNPHRPIDPDCVREIVEAARWAPTPHNMQNFELVIVDDADLLRKLGGIMSKVSEAFIRENYDQLSSSRKELSRKGVGILGAYFPAAWRDPAKFGEAARNSPPRPLSDTVDGSPLLMIVLYDRAKRAPASEGDFLGILGLGCVMENVWLVANSLGVSAQIMSVFGGSRVEGRVKRILGIPGRMKIGYAVRFGYPVHPPRNYPRVRRATQTFAFHNGYGAAHRSAS